MRQRSDEDAWNMFTSVGFNGFNDLYRRDLKSLEMTMMPMPDKADLWTLSGRGDNQEVELVPEAQIAMQCNTPVNLKQSPFRVLMVKVG